MAKDSSSTAKYFIGGELGKCISGEQCCERCDNISMHTDCTLKSISEFASRVHVP